MICNGHELSWSYGGSLSTQEIVLMIVKWVRNMKVPFIDDEILDVKKSRLLVPMLDLVGYWFNSI